MNTYTLAFKRASTPIIVFAMLGFSIFAFTGSATASVVPNVLLHTAGEYSVLAGSTVTNTGNSVLGQSVGLYPGTSITGFPPGVVNAPSYINQTNDQALQAKSDLTAAYVDAQSRAVDSTTAADLTGVELHPGVYSAFQKGPLLLTGTLTLNGDGDPASVFIIQTDSSLDTASSSVVSLTNGATECNVYWVVGSSATIVGGSNFAGNILAQESISIGAAATIHGRALAQTSAVTLINDTFVAPTCNTALPTPTPTTTTTTTTTPAVTTTTVATPGGTNSPSASTPTRRNTGTATGTATGIDTGLVALTGAPQTGARPESESIPWNLIIVLNTVMICGAIISAYFLRKKKVS